jgi:threonine synthase
MQTQLASEGVWCEPASAAGAAGLLAEVQAGRLDVRGRTVVAVVTGHGLKDPDAITTRAAAPVVIAPTYAAFEAAVKL